MDMKTHALNTQVEKAFYEIQQICSVLRIVKQTFELNGGGLFNANTDLFLNVNSKLEELVTVQNNLQFIIEPENSFKAHIVTQFTAVLRTVDTWCTEFNESIAEHLPSSNLHVTPKDTDIANALFAAETLVLAVRKSITLGLNSPQVAQH